MEGGIPVSFLNFGILEIFGITFIFSDFLPSTASGHHPLYIEEISIGKALRRIDSRTGAELSDESQERSSFDGQIALLHYNSWDVLTALHPSSLTSTSSTTAADKSSTRSSQTKQSHLQARQKPAANTVSFNSSRAYMVVPRGRVTVAAVVGDGVFRVGVKFKTLAKNGLIFLMMGDDAGEFAAIVSTFHAYPLQHSFLSFTHLMLCLCKLLDCF